MTERAERDRLAEIEQRIKTAYYWNVLAVPSLVVDEDMEWLIEEVRRLRQAIRTWELIWNNADLIELRATALRDGTADR